MRMLMIVGRKSLQLGYNGYFQTHTGKYDVWLKPLKDYEPFWDSIHKPIGTSHSLTVEREDGLEGTIDLTGVKGFDEWCEEYQTHYNDMTYNWKAWRNRGLTYAEEIARLLSIYIKK